MKTKTLKLVGVAFMLFIAIVSYIEKDWFPFYVAMISAIAITLTIYKEL